MVAAFASGLSSVSIGESGGMLTTFDGACDAVAVANAVFGIPPQPANKIQLNPGKSVRFIFGISFPLSRNRREASKQRAAQDHQRDAEVDYQPRDVHQRRDERGR